MTSIVPRVLFAVALVLLVLRARDAKGGWPATFVGLCGGVSVVTRATFLPFLIAACGWLLFAWRRGGARRVISEA